MQSLACTDFTQHFPKLDKYISLFPAHGNDDEPPSVPALADDATSLRRQEILSEIQEKMRGGVLSSEPELEAGATGRNQKPSSVNSRIRTPGRGSGLGNEKTKRKGQTRDSNASGKIMDQGQVQIEDDDFFELAADSD